MKSTIILISALSLFACATKSSSVSNGVTVPELPKEYVQQDLSAKGVPGKISIPVDAQVYTSTLMNNDGSQEQVIVQVDTSNIELDIFKSKMSFSDAKTELEKNVFNKFDKYLYQDENSALIQAKKNMDGKELFDFVVVAMKDGKQFQLHPGQLMKTYTKEQVLKLFSIAKSLSL